MHMVWKLGRLKSRKLSFLCQKGTKKAKDTMTPRTYREHQHTYVHDVCTYT